MEPRLVGRLLTLLALTGCQESASESGRGSESLQARGSGVDGVLKPAVGMWGNDDGWSVVEAARFAREEPRRGKAVCGGKVSTRGGDTPGGSARG